MPEAEKYSAKILTDAKAAATPAEAWGMAIGGEQSGEAALPAGAAFNTGAAYPDTTPFGGGADAPTGGAEEA